MRLKSCYFRFRELLTVLFPRFIDQSPAKVTRPMGLAADEEIMNETFTSEQLKSPEEDHTLGLVSLLPEMKRLHVCPTRPERERAETHRPSQEPIKLKIIWESFWEK